jgi:serine protease Do
VASAKVLSVLHAIGSWQFKPVSLLVAGTLLVPAVQADDQPLQAPKPASADFKQLAAAFTKTTPISIADLKSMEQHVKTLVTQVSPTVVAVEVGYGSGSGVVISADGLVLTAGHVCGRPNRDVRFTFPDGKTARGKTLGLDRNSDAGLMRITDPGPWPHAEMGELAQANIGDWVLALGHPGGFDLRRSLVVRLGRIILLRPEVLQTDCTISPGDSGGPLFDMYGRVIGIHSAISSSIAQNFHVPVTEFYSAWDELVKGENASRFQDRPKAYFGATVIDDDAGCQLSQVEENGPAFDAGLKVGDIVLRVDERDVKVSASFRRWVAESLPGETLSLEIKRGEKVLSLDVKLRAQTARNP